MPEKPSELFLWPYILFCKAAAGKLPRVNKSNRKRFGLGLKRFAVIFDWVPCLAALSLHPACRAK